MVNFNPLLKYGQATIARCRQAEGLINKHCDFINDSLSTGNDILSNISAGRDLVEVSRHTPRIAQGFETNYQNTVDNILDNNLDKLELTEDLTDEEKEEFLKNIEGDRNTFVTFAMDGKPSIVLCGKNEFIKPTEKYDIVRRELEVPLKNKTLKIDNTFILNKEMVKETIKENKELFTTRMNMDENSDIDTIYEVLISEKSPLKENKAHDLIGIVLGYSPKNSVLYQLDNSIPNNIDARKHLTSYKKIMMKKLYAQDSPYKNFDNRFKETIARDIIRIGNGEKPFNTNWSTYGYTCRNIVTDDKHSQKLIKNITKSYKKAQKIINE